MSTTITPATAITRRLILREKRFVRLFVLTLIIAFSPFKSLGQVSALIFLGGLIFYVGVRPVHHLKKYMLIVFLYSFLGFYYWLWLQEEFSFANFFLFFVTMSSFLILFYDFRSVISDVLLRRLGAIALIFIWLESVYGIFQAVVTFLRAGTFDQSKGDFVWGTIAPPFDPAFSGSSPTFIVLISTLLLFSLALVDRRISFFRIVAYATVFVCWLLASLLHSLLYFIVATIVAIILTWSKTSNRYGSSGNRPRFKKSYGAWGIILAILFFIVVAPRILSNNISKIPFVFSKISDVSSDSQYLKLRAAYSTFFILPSETPLQPVFGIGPGQYNSRAALMATGEYLRRPLPLLPQRSNTFTSEYILPLFWTTKTMGGSSMHFPSSSWLVIYGETGLIGLLIAVFSIFKGIKRFRRYQSLKFLRMNLMMLILLIYLALMGLQNVYWEFTQAIFPAILTLKLCYDYLWRENKSLQKMKQLSS